MAPLIYLDTHVVVWLHSARLELFPASVLARVEKSDLLISPAVKLELQYLHEIRRIESPAEEVLRALGKEIGLRVCGLPFSEVVDAALAFGWTRDPFDRLIASQAALRERPLLTKDRTILSHCRWAVWGDTSDAGESAE